MPEDYETRRSVKNLPSRPHIPFRVVFRIPEQVPIESLKLYGSPVNAVLLKKTSYSFLTGLQK